MKLGLAAASLVALAACTTPPATMPPGPADYRIGYRDGCDAGYAYAGSPVYQPSDRIRPEVTDQPYASGWYAGFERCKGSYQRMQRTVSLLFGPP
jgi:hypothetical protein